MGPKYAKYTYCDNTSAHSLTHSQSALYTETHFISSRVRSNYWLWYSDPSSTPLNDVEKEKEKKRNKARTEGDGKLWCVILYMSKRMSTRHNTFQVISVLDFAWTDGDALRIFTALPCSARLWWQDISRSSRIAIVCIQYSSNKLNSERNVSAFFYSSSFLTWHSRTAFIGNEMQTQSSKCGVCIPTTDSNSIVCVFFFCFHLLPFTCDRYTQHSGYSFATVTGSELVCVCARFFSFIKLDHYVRH